MIEHARRFIETRLRDIRAAPEAWGGLEALEFQLLQLLELEVSFETPDPGREVLRAWQRFVRDRFPRNGPIYLHELVDDAATLVKLVLEFRQQQSIAPVFPLFDAEPTRGPRGAIGG